MLIVALNMVPKQNQPIIEKVCENPINYKHDVINMQKSHK